MARPKRLYRNSLLDSHKNVLFVYNPVAGRGKILRYLKVIEMIFKRDGGRIEFYPTKVKEADIKELSPKVNDGYDLIMCSGGDGTLNNMINIMMSQNCHTLLGYIPMGSTCDFAHSIRISRNPFLALRTVLFDGKVRNVDVGMLNDRYFAYVASFGALTRITYTTPQRFKKYFGYLAYVVSAVINFFPITTSSLSIRTNDKVMEGEYVAGIISNSRYVGGFKVMDSENALMNDGLMEVVLIRKPKSFFGLLSIGFALVGHKVNDRYMSVFQASEIEVLDKTGKGIDWNLDGEFGGNHVNAGIKFADYQMGVVTGLK